MEFRVKISNRYLAYGLALSLTLGSAAYFWGRKGKEYTTETRPNPQTSIVRQYDTDLDKEIAALHQEHEKWKRARGMPSGNAVDAAVLPTGIMNDLQAQNLSGIRADQMDINGDGVAEIEVTASEWCGNRGCIYNLYGQVDGRWRKIFGYGEVVKLGHENVNGFPTAYIIEENLSRDSGFPVILKYVFNGHSYTEAGKFTPTEQLAANVKNIIEGHLPVEQKRRELNDIQNTVGPVAMTDAIMTASGGDAANQQELLQALDNLVSALYATSGINPNSPYSIEAQLFGLLVDSALDPYDPLRLRKQLPPIGPGYEDAVIEKERETNPALDAHIRLHGRRPEGRELESIRQNPQGAIRESSTPLTPYGGANRVERSENTYGGTERRHFTLPHERQSSSNERNPQQDRENLNRDLDRVRGFVGNIFQQHSKQPEKKN